jgi:hypothetical protein
VKEAVCGWVGVWDQAALEKDDISDLDDQIRSDSIGGNPTLFR